MYGYVVEVDALIIVLENALAKVDSVSVLSKHFIADSVLVDTAGAVVTNVAIT